MPPRIRRPQAGLRRRPRLNRCPTTTRLPEKLAELRGKLAGSDWKPFNTAVHKLVGTVGTYQLEEIYRVAEELEHVAEREDAEASAALLDRLTAAVDRATAKAGLIG